MPAVLTSAYFCSRLKLKATSAGVIGEPLENFTPWRIVNVIDLPPLAPLVGGGEEVVRGMRGLCEVELQQRLVDQRVDAHRVGAGRLDVGVEVLGDRVLRARFHRQYRARGSVERACSRSKRSEPRTPRSAPRRNRPSELLPTRACSRRRRVDFCCMASCTFRYAGRSAIAGRVCVTRLGRSAPARRALLPRRALGGRRSGPHRHAPLLACLERELRARRRRAASRPRRDAPPIGRSGGDATRQRSSANGQRGLKRQPAVV